MIRVSDIFPKLVGVGNRVDVNGVGLDSSCEILVDGKSLPVIDFDENSITFEAPVKAGSYKVSVRKGGYTSDEMALSVVAVGGLQVWCPERKSEDEFRDVLLGLMPSGMAWKKTKGSNWWKFFHGLAAPFLAAYIQLRELSREIHPSTTTSLLEWERELALPRKGVIAEDEASRLAEVYRVAGREFKTTPYYFKKLAEELGYEINIYEYWKNPEVFDGYDFGDDDPNFYWMIEKVVDEDVDVKYATCNDTCNDYLRDWWDGSFEQFFTDMSKAHTRLLFKYDVGDGGSTLLTEDGETLLTEDGEAIVLEESV